MRRARQECLETIKQKIEDVKERPRGVGTNKTEALGRRPVYLGRMVIDRDIAGFRIGAAIIA
jgi:hypothetical protein